MDLLIHFLFFDIALNRLNAFGMINDNERGGLYMFGIGKAGKRNIAMAVKYDPAKQKAVLKCSICTGEQVAGFQDIHSGKFEEVMLVRGESDLQYFKQQYGVEEITKIY